MGRRVRKREDESKTGRIRAELKEGDLRQETSPVNSRQEGLKKLQCSDAVSNENRSGLESVR
eukprot:762853-Hanusia_phi.AAC.3